MSNGKIPSPEDFERQMAGGGIPTPEQFEQQMGGGIPTPEDFERQMAGGGIPTPEQFERKMRQEASWEQFPLSEAVPEFVKESKPGREAMRDVGEALKAEKLKEANIKAQGVELPMRAFEKSQEARALLSPKTPYIERAQEEIESAYPRDKWPKRAKEKQLQREEKFFTETMPQLPGGKALGFLAPSRRERAKEAQEQRREFYERKIERAGEQAKLATGARSGLITRQPGLPAGVDPATEPHEGFLQELDKPLGAPFRFVAGGAKSAKDWLHYWMTPEGFYEKKPAPYWKTISESVMYENPLYMGDVMKEALSTSLGRKLEPSEEIAAGVFGLFSEIMGPGQATKVLRMGRGGPEATGISKRMEQALTGAGAKVLQRGGKAKKKFLTGKMKPIPPEETAIPLAEGPALSKWEINRAAENIAEEMAHPTRLAKAMDYIEDAGKRMGLDPNKIHEARVSFLKLAGPEGKYMGKTGYGLRVPTTRAAAERELLGEMKASKIEAPTQEIAEKMAQVPPRDIPLGAKPVGIPALPFVGRRLGDVFYGASGGTGVAEAVRPWQAYRFREGAEAIRAGKKLQDMIPLEAGKEALKMRDLRSNLELFEDAAAKAELKISKAGSADEVKAFTDELARQEAVLQSKFRQHGVTEAEVRLGYQAKTPSEKAAVQAYGQGMEDMYQVAKNVGLEPEYVSHYVYRTLTKEMRELRAQVLGGRGAKTVGQEEFLRGRTRIEKGALGIDITGTRGKEFVEPLASNYVARRQANAVAISAKGAEDSLLYSYGREVTEDVAKRMGFDTVEELVMSKPYQSYLKSQGLRVHAGKLGSNKGRWFAMDEATSNFLNRMVDPPEMKKWVKAWGKLHNWWKSQATVLRPGFVVRNVLAGNLWQLWQADVNLGWAMPMAIRATIKSRLRDPMGVTRLQDDFMRGMDDLMTLETKGGEMIRPGMTLDDAIDLGRSTGAEGGGFFGRELEEFGTKGLGFFESMKRGRQAGEGVGKQILRGAAKGLEAAVPVTSGSALLRANAWMNKFGEDVARWAMFLDRMKKGYSNREALRDISKYIFNYNELSQFVQSGKQVASFLTWNWKNAGMQLSTLLNKPDKFFNFGRMFYGIQDLDMLTEEERRIAEKKASGMDLEQWEEARMGKLSLPMAQWGQKNLAFTMPFLRGPEGERRFITTVGFIPMTSLQQMNPIELGDTVVSLINPWVRRGFEEFAGSSKEERANFWGAVPRDQIPYMARVPGVVEAFMNKIHGSFLYDIMSYWIPPAIDRWGKVTGHRWPADVQESMQNLLPVFGVLSRMTRPKQDQVYSTIISTLTGMKLYDLNEDMIERERRSDARKVARELEEINKRYKALGYMPDPRRPFPNPGFGVQGE